MNIFQIFKKNIHRISVDKIAVSDNAPRFIYSEEGLRELTRSVVKYGVTEPITVCETAPNEYRVICGEKRIRAVLLAGKTEIPCEIAEFYSPSDEYLFALKDNMSPPTMHFIEEGYALYKLTEYYGRTIRECAKALNITDLAVENKLALLSLTDAEKSAVIHYNLSEKHALILAAAELTEQEKIAAMRVATGYGFSSAQLAAFISGMRYNVNAA